MIDRVIFFESLPGGLAHPLRFIWISPQMENSLAHAFRVTRLYE
jgi:hypothetical protein